MALINYATREIQCKIVYYGTGLGGKTTNLEYIHKQLDPSIRGDMVSLKTADDRTLYFDFLPLDLGSVQGFKTKFSLYTVPGQVLYNASRKLVLNGADGIIFVADSQKDKFQENVEMYKNMEENLKENMMDMEKIPLVLQYNKRDLPDILSIEEMDASMNTKKVPYFEAIAKEGTGVFATLKSMSKEILRRFTMDR